MEDGEIEGGRKILHWPGSSGRGKRSPSVELLSDDSEQPAKAAKSEEGPPDLEAEEPEWPAMAKDLALPSAKDAAPSSLRSSTTATSALQRIYGLCPHKRKACT